MLDVRLSKEFDRIKPFKVTLEGDFGSIEITEPCLLELQKIVLPRVETLSITASIFTSEEPYEAGGNGQPSVSHLFGLKHFDLPFAREPVQIKVLCGPQMNQAYYLTLRLYV